ncbi:30S ribosomal protein S8 [Candidatus Uhrbacteria bacterium]|nr:30S ribosomal protein S8 [Candidatus Uhrbacteria bacterium]
MTDPIADMLSRIRNASRVQKEHVSMPSSRIKKEIAHVLKDEGYIRDFQIIDGSPRAELAIDLQYTSDRVPAINALKRISKPGCRMYVKADTMPVILQHMGIAIISTSKGVMSNKQAKKMGLGGEILCTIS